MRTVVVLLCLSSVARGLSPVQKTEVGRRSIALSTLATVVAATTSAPENAVAYRGIYGMDIVGAKEAVLDPEALKSAGVQDAIKSLRSFESVAADLKKSLASDSQFDVQKVLRKDFEITKIRNTFNDLTVLFDKDTQKGTDIIQRGIIQDLVEIDNNSKLTPGKPRSDKKLAFLTDKLDKLQEAFQKLDAYLSAA